MIHWLSLAITGYSLLRLKVLRSSKVIGHAQIQIDPLYTSQNKTTPWNVSIVSLDIIGGYHGYDEQSLNHVPLVVLWQRWMKSLFEAPFKFKFRGNGVDIINWRLGSLKSQNITMHCL